MPLTAAFHPIDLTKFYTHPFTNRWSEKPWSLIPVGEQIIQGVPFRVGGKIELTGIQAAIHGDLEPAEVAAIPIHTKAARLFILHAAAHGYKDGAPLAKLVLNYEDGQTHTVRLAYGVHARNWIRHGIEKRSTPDDAASTLAWSASSGDGDTVLRMYRTIIENPHPGVEIASVDYISLFSKATPILFAITVDGNTAAPSLTTQIPHSRKSIGHASAYDDSTYVGEITISVSDAQSGQPLTNASAQLTVVTDGEQFPFGSAVADKSGRMKFKYPVQDAVALRLLVRAPGKVPNFVDTSRAAATGLRREIPVLLTNGVAIGGIVQSKTGQKIPSAEVLIYSQSPQLSNEVTQIGIDSVVTDLNGHWSSTCLAPGFQNIRFHLAHPEFKSIDYSQESSSASNLLQVSTSDLLAGRAAMPMEPRIHLAGRITDNKGLALTNAQIFYRGPERLRQKLRTDAAGKFSWFLNDPGPATIAFQADNFAPQAVPLDLSPDLQPLKIILQKGFQLSGTVRDQKGSAVEGATVSLESFNASRLVYWHTQTDAKGRFVWTNAPTGGLTFRVSKDNFISRTLAVAVPPRRDVVMQLNRASRLSGDVLDADTKEPLPQFDVIKGHHNFPEEPLRWDRGNAYSYKRGQFSTSLNDENFAETRLLIEAPGYSPIQTEAFKLAGLYTNIFLMHKAPAIEGQVLLPSGKPALKAMVLLVGPADDPRLDGPTEFRTGYNRGAYTTTRGDGHFTLPPRLDANTIVATHSLGFCLVSREEFSRTGKINLQRWGHLAGHFQPSGLAQSNAFLALHSYEHNLPIDAHPQLSFLFRTRPDSKGNFSFDKVPPGEWELSLLYRLPDTAHGPPPVSAGVPVTINSGETNRIQFRPAGRTLIGKVCLPYDLPKVDWFQEPFFLRSDPSGMPAFEPDNYDERNSEGTHAGKRWEAARREYLFWSSPRGRALSHAQRSFMLLFQTNGSFRIENVPPGNYRLLIAPTDAKSDRYSREVLGLISRNITVRAAKSNEPLDLGALNLELRPGLHIGQSLPPVQLKTMDN
ncbi:MAG TPA: carboxypeptidase regulatory-like domain-containing protein, partial [Verrucomicrobiae bacterium]